jgi:hypothetical protein
MLRRSMPRAALAGQAGGFREHQFMADYDLFF